MATMVARRPRPAESFVCIGLGPAPSSVQRHCRMKSSKSQLLRYCFQEWVKYHAINVRGHLEAEILTLRNQLSSYGSNGKISIWKMRKAELVEYGVTILGWDRQTAETETVGQLRLYLKEAGEVAKPDQVLPKGLNRLKKAELQATCLERNISVAKPEGRELSREEMIRELKQWAASRMQTDQTPESAPPPGTQACSSGAPTTATGRPILAGMRGGTEHYMMVDGVAEAHRNTRRHGHLGLEPSCGAHRPGSPGCHTCFQSKRHEARQGGEGNR